MDRVEAGSHACETMITGLHHVAMAVKALQATAAYDREVFGDPAREKTEKRSRSRGAMPA
jgi:hypothetical protein